MRALTIIVVLVVAGCAPQPPPPSNVPTRPNLILGMTNPSDALWREQSRLERQYEYCADLSHSMWTAGASLRDLQRFDANYWSADRLYYFHECMRSFARTDRLLGR